MAVVPVQEVTQEDLKDPNLSVLNDIIRKMQIEINRLNGIHGNIQLNGNIDLQGKFKVINQAL